MTTPAVVHFPSPVSRADAVFYVDEAGALQGHEIEMTPALSGAWMVLLDKTDEATWEQFFETLSEANPAPDTWEAVTIEDGVSVEEFVRVLRS